MALRAAAQPAAGAARLSRLLEPVAGGQPAGAGGVGDSGWPRLALLPDVLPVECGVKVTLDYPPSSNRYWRHVDGKVLLSAAARDYRRLAGLQAACAGMRAPLEGPVVVTLTLYRPAKRGDLDNRVKVLLDALNGIAYRDDSQVVELHAYRREDRANPRVEVDVMEAGASVSAQSRPVGADEGGN